MAIVRGKTQSAENIGDQIVSSGQCYERAIPVRVLKDKTPWLLTPALPQPLGAL
ncbi:hypothetical protein IWX88_000148 [Frigoribacterium sp. CG_9.8]|nr:hypothetical protein [Frigoribacterium sp. CG_9.8]